MQPDGDYILGGYSFGCIVIYEIAKQLEEKGKKVSILAILDRSGSEPIYRYYTKLYCFLSQCKQFLRQILTNYHKNSTPFTNNSQISYLMQGYSGKIQLFLASEYHEFIPLEIKLQHFLFPLRGWNKKIIEQVYRIPGNHHSMLQEPHVKVLADRLTFLFAHRNQ